MNQRKAGAVLNYISLFVNNGIALLFLPFMVRVLGQSEYGLYQLVGSVSAYLSILDLGLSATVIRYVAKYRAVDDQAGVERFISLVSVIYGLLAAMVIVVGLGLYRLLPTFFETSLTTDELSRAKTMFLLFLANAAVTILTNGFRGICAAYEHFVFLRLQDIAQSLLRVIVLFVLLSAGSGSVAVVITDLMLNVLFSGLRIAYAFLRLQIRFRLRDIEWTLLSEVANFAFFIFLNTVINRIYWQTGNMILGILTNTAVVAVYSIGSYVSMLYLSFSTAISDVLLPYTVYQVERNASGAHLTDLMIRTGRIQMIVLGLILTGFASFGQEFILLWVGPNYKEAYWVALIVMLPLSIPLVQNVGISILQAKNKHRFRALAYLAVAILTIPITILLVRAIGMVGAAISTAAGLIVGNIIVINIYYHRAIGLEIPRFFREVCHGIVPMLLVMVLIGVGLDHLWAETSWVGLLAKIAAFAFIYVVAMWFHGMNLYEKGLLKAGRAYVAIQQEQ